MKAPVSTRSGTHYRELDAAAAATKDDTYLNDARFDGITEKVIQYMDRTDPEQWTKDQWQLFRVLWMDRKSKRRTPPTEQPAVAGMSTEDLRRSMSSAAMQNS